MSRKRHYTHPVQQENISFDIIYVPHQWTSKNQHHRMHTEHLALLWICIIHTGRVWLSRDVHARSWTGDFLRQIPSEYGKQDMQDSETAPFKKDLCIPVKKQYIYNKGNWSSKNMAVTVTMHPWKAWKTACIGRVGVPSQTMDATDCMHGSMPIKSDNRLGWVW